MGDILNSRRAVIVDNNDSFTYNIAQYLAMGGAEVVVLPNVVEVSSLKKARPSHLVISAGGGSAENPPDCGNCYEILDCFIRRVPVLGICLGHQIISRDLGAKIVPARDIRHGRVSRLHMVGPSKLLDGISDGVGVMRYHSSVVARSTLPPELRVTSVAADDDEVMSVEAPGLRLYGVQFHPESVGSPQGMRVMCNFLAM